MALKSHLEKSRAHFSVLGGDFGEKIKKSHAEKCKGRQATTNAKNVRRRPKQKALAKKFRRYVMIRRNFSEFFAFFRFFGGSPNAADDNRGEEEKDRGKGGRPSSGRPGIFFEKDSGLDLIFVSFI